MDETLSQRIARLRLAAGLSRGELALNIRAMSGRMVISKWESGTVPNGRWVAALADALGVSSHYLLTGRESEFTTSEPAPDTSAGA